MKGPAFGVRRLDAALHFRGARANLPRHRASAGGLAAPWRQRRRAFILYRRPLAGISFSGSLGSALHRAVPGLPSTRMSSRLP